MHLSSMALVISGAPGIRIVPDGELRLRSNIYLTAREKHGCFEREDRGDANPHLNIPVLEYSMHGNRWRPQTAGRTESPDRDHV
jgi:hypothetical protein